MTTLKKIRILIVFYIVALVVAGVTAFPVECELKLLCSIFSIDQETINQMKDNAIQPLFSWLYNVKIGITETNDKYPYLLRCRYYFFCHFYSPSDCSRMQALHLCSAAYASL